MAQSSQGHICLISLEANSVDSWHDLSLGVAAVTGTFKLKQISSVYAVYDEDETPINSKAKESDLVVCLLLECSEKALDVQTRLQNLIGEHCGSKVQVRVLMYEEEFFMTPQLTLPDPELHGREKYLIPAAEIGPSLKHAVLGQTLTQILQERAPRRWGEFQAQGKSLLDFFETSK